MNGPDGKRFTWGKIVQVHHIESYEIVEAKVEGDWETTGPLVGKPHNRFFPFVNGKDTCMSTTDLDGALATAIAYRHGDVSGAAIYFMRMLKR
jgi:hypothetical protein